MEHLGVKNIYFIVDFTFIFDMDGEFWCLGYMI